MLAELRPKAQVTIPKELVDKLGLSEGDKFDVLRTTEQSALCRLPCTRNSTLSHSAKKSKKRNAKSPPASSLSLTI